MKRILTLFLLLLLLPACTIAETNQKYEQYLTLLDAYLDPNASALFDDKGLETICNGLLDSRGQYFSEFFMYGSILYAIKTNDYDEANAFIQVLEANSDFSAHLDSAAFQAKYPNIGTLDELSLYLQGCQMAYSGNTGIAKTYFIQCVDFYDSAARLQFSSYTSASAPNGPWPIGQTIKLTMKNSAAHARSGPGEEYDFVAYVFNGDIFTILDQKPASNGKMWFKVKVGDQYGWITSGLTHTDIWP